MKAVAVVCEYNPLHTGHVYHMQQAKQRSGADTVVGVMSGCFVQRAEPAVLSPAVRASMAIDCGMDAVVELPVLFSCGAGSLFAEGALRTMSRIQGISYLSMGVEDDESTLLRIAEVQSEESERYRKTLQDRLQNGAPYAAAMTEATAQTVGGQEGEQCAQALQKPNNVLAIEYVKAIYRHNLPIRPVFVPRIGNAYHDETTNGEYISATAARTLLRQNNFVALQEYIPQNCLQTLTEEYARHKVNELAFDALTVHALRTKDISSAPDAGEGLENKLRTCALRFPSLLEICEHAKSKRYTMQRIRRVCLQTLLGITKDALKDTQAAVGRLIAVKNTRKDVLRAGGMAIRNNDYAAFGEGAQRLAQIDGTAGSVYALLTDREGNAFWDRKTIIR